MQNQINLGCIPEPELHGFNIHDPFCLTYPDRLPYHLASLSDEDKKTTSRLRSVEPETAALSSYPDHPRQPQPSRISQVSSNILVDDFDPQGGAPFGDVWSNNFSYPSKSTSCMSQLPETGISFEQEQQQQQSTMSDYYDLDISQ